MSQADKKQETSDKRQTSNNSRIQAVTSFISLASVRHGYREGNATHPVLKDINLEIGRGEKVALLGRSGSGKSTLLNLISGIDRPGGGSILIDGTDVTAMDETHRTLFRRRHIGFIYQFFNLVPSLTALENVVFTLELNGCSGSEMYDRGRALLLRLGIEEDKTGAFPSRLSGGEQQRVAIARALVHAPAVVLADEPTGNLDARTGTEVLAVLHDVLQKSRSALLLVTHSLAVAKTADRIITLEDGVVSERHGEFAW